jgi:putative transposase
MRIHSLQNSLSLERNPCAIMPRIARLVVCGLPHHVIQRGNRRQKVFFSDKDKVLYLEILRKQSQKTGIRFWAYCLMENHVHFVAVPDYPDSFSRGLGEAHRRYTSLINIRENWTGFLWQGRFLSNPLDEAHLFAAARYIERNPVRAGLVNLAEEYPWSSAKAHVLGIRDSLLSEDTPSFFSNNWAHRLRIADQENELQLFGKHAQTGRPLGNEAFIQNLENSTGRKIAFQKRGRKPKEIG